ncbi:MAG TPA: outer-membrane lipoprotein carrier protein LolA, partial [Bryobacteraceae bacterium]|nr:outer-membrane lipoprotein carrier protein LolA [Bryobacteraceae bacterium]
MMSRFLVAFVCLLPLFAAEGDVSVSEHLRALEKRYNSVRTLRVNFEETYKAGTRTARAESGELFLRKPGRMRWEYSDPAGK